MKHKFILFLLIVLFVISTSLCGLGFYYDIKNNNENVNNNKNNDNKCDDKPKEVLECTFDGELVQGAEYVNGQYTYRYMQERGLFVKWININEDGWGVMLADKESTDPVTTKLCNTINGKPIVSMSYMFDDSNATEIDLSSFDTSNVVDMSGMFTDSSALELDLSSFDTRSVTNMYDMFFDSRAIEIVGLNKFDTANVIDMSRMFANSSITKLDLSSFDTSSVTSMNFMFSNTAIKELDLSNFNILDETYVDGMLNDVKSNIVYVRTKKDIDKLKEYAGSPSNLNFVVKQ